MSQVKIQKLATGGTFIIDGKEISGDDAINAIRPYLGETTGGIMDALRAGETVDYNSANNTIKITNKNGQSLTDTYLSAGKKAHVGDSTLKKDLGATFNTATHRFKEDLLKLRGVTFGGSNSSSNNSSLSQLRKGSGWFYTKDKDGNDIFEEGPLNKDRLAVLNEFRKYVEHYGDLGEDATKKKYSTEGWDSNNLKALQNYFATYKDQNSRDTYWKNLEDKIRNNKLENPDKEMLRLMGFNDGIVSGTPGITPADKTKWNDAGFGELVKILGDKAHLNDDGSLSLNDGESWGWNLGDLAGRNIWFNDDFYKSQYGADGSFDPFRNLTLYNNRLYTLNNPTLARILNSDGGFNSMKASGNWVGADNLIRTRFTEAAQDNPSYLGPEEYSTFLSGNPSYRFSDLTGLVEIPGMNKDDQIIQYVDLNDNSLVGPYRQYQYKYALLDNRGNLKRELSQNDLIDLQDGAARDTGLNTYKKVSGDNGETYSNRYYEDIFDKDKEATGFRFYRDIDKPNEDIILHMPEISGTNIKERDLKLPKEIAEVLMQNLQNHQNGDSWIDYVVGNAQNKANFMDWVSSLVHSRYRNSNRFWNEKSNLRKMGFSDEEIQKLEESIKESRSGNRAERRNKYLVTSPILEKNGGVLKYQTGGRARGAKTATGVTEKQISVKNTNPKNSATLGGGTENWTNADTLEVGALVADLGSLAAAFIPGANVASAVTGAGASTARFAADRQRGTKGAGWNYLLNLGMDAATLLPIIGGATKSVQVVNAVKKALPTIIKAASVYGLGSAVINSATKIANGDKWTIRDISNVVNGLTAGVGLGKQGGLGRSTKTTKTKGYSENFKVGDTDVKLDNDQIVSIMKSPDQAEALRKAISERAKGASKEEINKALDKLLKPKQTTWQKIRKKEGKVVLNVKKKPNTSTEQLEAIEGKPLYNWWHKLGPSYAEYNMQLQGESPLRAYRLNRTDTNVYNSNSVGFRRAHRTKGTATKKRIPYEDYKAAVPKGRRSFTEEFTPGFRELETGPGLIGNAGVSKFTAYTTRKGIGVALPQFINSFTKANYQSNIDQQPSGAVYQPTYKRGGRIIKAQNGISLIDSNFGYDFSTDTFKNWWKDEGNSTFTKERTPLTLQSITAPTAKAQYPIYNAKGEIVGHSDVQTNNISNLETQRKAQYEEGLGGLPGNKWMLNKPNVDDAIRAGITARAIYQDRDLQRLALGKLYQRQFQTPEFDRAKYDYTTIEHGFNESMKPLRERKFVSSDLAYNLSDKHQTDQQFLTALGNKYGQLSQQKSQIDDINRQIEMQNKSNRVQTANEKSQYLTNLNYQDAMLDSVTWNRLFSDVINPFGQQMSQQGRDAWNKNLRSQYQFDAQNAQRIENARIQGALLNNYKDKWNALTSDQKKQYGDIETYVYSTDPEGYKKIINGNDIYRGTMFNLMRKYSRAGGAGMWYYKSGGTINISNTNKNQRSAQEQIAINSAKSAKRSVDELSKALLKMLAQLTK